MTLRCFACKTLCAAVIPFVTVAHFGCESGGQSGSSGPDVGPNVVAPARGNQTPSASDGSDAVIINGVMVAREAFWTQLAEFGGGQVLEEYVLDTRLEREMERRGLRLSDHDIEQEEANLLSLILGQATNSEDEAARIIDSTRQTRGLGPERYKALLRRNAMLRRLVRDDVEITEDDIQRLYDVRHGEKVRARIIVVANERRASDLRAELLASGADRVSFAAAAMDHSLDATRAAGGLIEVFSTSDPAYPSAARLALDRVAPGELTPVIGLESGFAFLLLEERISPDEVTYDERHADLLREFRLRQERILMQQLALELIGTTRVTPVDRAIGWSWRVRTESR